MMSYYKILIFMYGQSCLQAGVVLTPSDFCRVSNCLRPLLIRYSMYCVLSLGMAEFWRNVCRTCTRVCGDLPSHALRKARYSLSTSFCSWLCRAIRTPCSFFVWILLSVYLRLIRDNLVVPFVYRTRHGEVSLPVKVFSLRRLAQPGGPSVKLTSLKVCLPPIKCALRGRPSGEGSLLS